MVIEYNARFGDPETQVVLPLLESDLFDIMEAVADEKLDKIDIKWANKSAVCIIMASGGYPGKYETGFEIKGLEKAEKVFHAGTKKSGDKYLTGGGRVLGVVSVKDNMDEAIESAYRDVSEISFKNAYYRKDIGR